jgi:hypothetical protein
MTRIALVIVFLAAAVGVGYRVYPTEVTQYVGLAADAAPRVWDGIAANPVPVALALGTFLLTVLYHKAKGKSLRESVEVAATRVTVVPVPITTTGEDENAVVRRAKARATRTQLVADQIGLQNRLRKLPEVILKAETDACYTEQALADVRRALADKEQAHDKAVAKLEALRKEQAAGEAELAEIEVELKKLADLV